jgi:ABC-type multidrug transport system fused ATPase/permease subunit
VVLIVLGVLGSVASIVADASLLLILAIGIVIISPITALMTATLFGGIGFFLYYLMNVKAREYGLSIARLDILSSTKIMEVLNSYRESVVRNRRDFYAQEIKNIRFELSGALARMQFLPNVSKYVIEAAVVLGSLLISAIQFLFLDSSHAVATLSIFLAAGSRIAPAVLRAQQAAVNIKSNLAASGPTLSIMRELGANESPQRPIGELELSHDGFVPDAALRGVSFGYPGATADAISRINVFVKPGTSLAVVGPSGSGKTTLIDLMLGVLEPLEGEILISSINPINVVNTWPGAIAYVPQDVRLITGTVRENIALGFPTSSAKPEHYENCLRIAQLMDFVANLPNGLDTQIGENGAKLSGGQKQRLGIARAMFTNPRFLVLDEATSALDAETENDLSNSLSELKGKVTLIIVAHRLSTVRHADQVMYLNAGHCMAIGSFDEVRESVPNFDKQAKLMGL